jgi:hypothetical protein
MVYEDLGRTQGRVPKKPATLYWTKCQTHRGQTLRSAAVVEALQMVARQGCGMFDSD